jgi:hypothetical protein
LKRQKPDVVLDIENRKQIKMFSHKKICLQNPGEKKDEGIEL